MERVISVLVAANVERNMEHTTQCTLDVKGGYGRTY